MLALSTLMGKSPRWPFLVLALFLSLSALSQSSFRGFSETPGQARLRSDEQETVQISEEFHRGAHLIYDCRKRHYICVGPSGYQQCRQRRQQSFEKRDSVFSCAPLKAYKNSQQCQERLYLLVHRAASKAFCINHHLSPLQE